MNILVIKPCCLGEVLMTTPLVATLRSAYRDARIDYAVGSSSMAALVSNPDLDDVLPILDGAGPGVGGLVAAIRAAWRLRWRRYDLAFLPDRSAWCYLVAYLAGIPRRFGISGSARSLLVSDSVVAPPDEHLVDVYLRLAEAAGLRRQVVRDLKYVPTQVSLERAVHVLRNQGFDTLPFRVALHPGTDSEPRSLRYHRRWPPQRYSLLANELIARYGGGVILLGDEADRELNFLVRNDIDHPVLDLTGRLDVDAMGAVMQLCDAVIANDTGPMHLAVAVGTPTVGIFGPTWARNRGPYGAHHRAVQAHIWCGPCADLGGPMEGCGAACVQRITVQDVFAVLEARAG